MMKRIKIRDFKSIRDVDLLLDPVTVLVGRSGTGKSNLVQAARFVRNYLLNPTTSVEHERGWDHILPAGSQGPKPSFELVFSVPGELQDYTYRLAFIKHGPSQNLILNEELLTIGETPVFSRSRSATNFEWIWQQPPKVVPAPGQSEAPMLGALPSLHQATLAYAALTRGIGYYHFPASTLTSATNADQRRQNMNAFVEGLSDDASNYVNVMRGILQSFQNPNLRKNILASVQTINPTIDSIEVDPPSTPRRAIIAHRSGDLVFSLELEQESDGLRRFYAHLLALYQAPSKLTSIFEEPENAIFPGALSLLADEFKAAPRDNRGQVILTTHSPILLDSFDVENVRVVEMRDGATVVGPVSQEQRDAVRDKLLTTGELLTVDKARIEEAAA